VEERALLSLDLNLTAGAFPAAIHRIREDDPFSSVHFNQYYLRISNEKVLPEAIRFLPSATGGESQYAPVPGTAGGSLKGGRS
jgi:hypothetical protein